MMTGLYPSREVSSIYMCGDGSLKNKIPLAKLLWLAAALVIIATVFQFVKVLAYLLGIVMLGVSAYLLYDSCRKLERMNSDKH
jgi:predicted DNA repair protein MutK